MQVLDIAVIATVLISALLGAWRGLVQEVLALASWVVAFFVAKAFSPQVAQMLGAYFAKWIANWSATALGTAAFVLVFIAVVFLCSALTSLVKKLLNKAGMRPADRTLGAVFGLVRGAALLVLAAALVDALGWQEQTWWQHSRSAQWLEVASAQIKDSSLVSFTKFLPPKPLPPPSY